MGNSVILKDTSGLPAGYAMAAGNEIECRVKLDAPAEIMLIFSDGTCAVHEVCGGAEQRFESGGKKMIGCCVFRAETVLLCSDEMARCTVQGRLSWRRDDKRKKTEYRKESGQNTQTGEQICAAVPLAKSNSLPEQRWPPSPCWDTACYKEGRWQESERLS